MLRGNRDYRPTSFQFLHPEDREQQVPQRALEAARKSGRFEAEWWRIRRDGTRFWALAVIDAVRDESGELIGFRQGHQRHDGAGRGAAAAGG
ncbi:PAS domain-containing protein [Rhodoligotrophos appendicifer]|uniref:PAS domain-containing protein n=1 Tax=Rhodoligotrophos appendicifer TaxID=987056 RepID=UPI001FE7D425|nr:PAS domain-containing protein [Rhodoligotrophos appendicifer]